MKALIHTVTGEEYTGTVSGFINLAYGKLTEGITSKQFGICLHMRIAPITFNTIKDIKITYLDSLNNIQKRFFQDLYLFDPLTCRDTFFIIRAKFLDESN